ncbi:protein kinase family protein [Aegicerativicinus sediminis]|uniref:protein kinase family protein n=1 Tax=Aegicerativicinus sediminis TaxID=2893202 RepID=UPI001E633405|nr:protein kinase family protein [Aegicerativicinus sediminis]
MEQKIIKFLRSKDFKFIEEVGQGGTGRTVLLEDEIINERFVCKKYSPYYPETKTLFFDNFKEEIKLLHLLYHPNVVRVFNYYLYPEEFTGYILMEYIKGCSIDNYLEENPDKLNSVFEQTVDGFLHLEKNKILHRDIRPENILVNNDGIVKIIDFGFGKKIEFDKDFDKSISLNWRYSLPKDFKATTYDFSTEVYFLGMLFHEIIQDYNLQDFAFDNVLKQMTIKRKEDRISSFFDLKRSMIEKGESSIEFTNDEKSIYDNFASGLEKIFGGIYEGAVYRDDIPTILKRLQDLYNVSLLETYIQNPNKLTNCFVNGKYRYTTSYKFHVSYLKKFIAFFSGLSIERKKIVLNHLWQRIDKIERIPDYDDDLPF